MAEGAEDLVALIQLSGQKNKESEDPSVSLFFVQISQKFMPKILFGLLTSLKEIHSYWSLTLMTWFCLHKLLKI